jgi:glycosyltransferase involved in cell wall biosynthesis
MKVLHLIGGKESAGSKNHLLPLLERFDKQNVYLCVFERGEIYDEAKQLGIKVFWLRQNTRYDATALFRLKAIMNGQHIDILHTHGARANVYGFLLKPFIRFTWMTTVHSDPRLDFFGRGLKGQLFTRMNVQVLKKADHIFAISARFKNILESLGVSSQRITVIYNGISFKNEDENFAPLQRGDIGLSDEDFVLLTVARLHPIKGHMYLLKALRKVVDVCPHLSVKWLIIGDGLLKQRLADEARRWGLGERVILLGHQKNAQPFYELADVMVLPSLSESFPLVILEAAKARVPVIATDVGGVGDLIIDRRYGWLVPPKDVEALYQAIVGAVALKKKGILKQRGSRLAERVNQNFSLEHLVERINKAYLLFGGRAEPHTGR